MEEIRRALRIHSSNSEYILKQVGNEPVLHWLEAHELSKHGLKEILNAVQQSGCTVLHHHYDEGKSKLVALIEEK
ncbi:hypothetical protein J4220_03205 [Candidatus Micrarchaeota archaeon]|nr:hypothetical protein [Candidatus Micrarchaeota archaeon]